jgi:hypothetical protein
MNACKRRLNFVPGDSPDDDKTAVEIRDSDDDKLPSKMVNAWNECSEPLRFRTTGARLKSMQTFCSKWSHKLR